MTPTDNYAGLVELCRSRAETYRAAQGSPLYEDTARAAFGLNAKRLDQAAAAIESLTTRLTEAEAEIQRLREALERIARPLGNPPDIGDRGYTETVARQWWRDLTVDCRSIARRALTEGNQPHD